VARGAGDLGQLDELALAQAQDLAADHPCVPRPQHRPEDDHDVPHARPDHRRQEDREDEGRQSEPRIGEPHDRLVDPAAEIARENAERRADGAGDDGSHHADDQGDARAVYQPADNIAPLEVGTQQRRRICPLHPERRLENLGARDRLGRVVGRDGIGKHRDQNERDEDRQRQCRQLAGEPQQAPPQPEFARSGGSGEDCAGRFSGKGHGGTYLVSRMRGSM
jgi:hypothetical protein